MIDAKKLFEIEEHKPPAELFEDVAGAFSHGLPEDSIPKSWKHGSFRVLGMIDGYDVSSLEWTEWTGVPEGINLSNVQYCAFYRQAVRNKHSQIMAFFYAMIPCESIGEANPGDVVKVKEYIPFDWDREKLEQMAEKSFRLLQQRVLEYYNAE